MGNILISWLEFFFNVWQVWITPNHVKKGLNNFLRKIDLIFLVNLVHFSFQALSYLFQRVFVLAVVKSHIHYTRRFSSKQKFNHFEKSNYKYHPTWKNFCFENSISFRDIAEKSKEIYRKAKMKGKSRKIMRMVLLVKTSKFFLDWQLLK